jgi:hypothetical protein
MIMLIVLIVILPLALIGASLTQQAATVVGRIKSANSISLQTLPADPTLLAWATGLLQSLRRAGRASVTCRQTG